MLIPRIPASSPLASFRMQSLYSGKKPWNTAVYTLLSVILMHMIVIQVISHKIV